MPLRSCLALLLALVAVLPGCGAPEGPPNIIVLVTDDQRADMLGVVHPLLETPHLDRLAEGGVRFSNAFVTTSICAVSRATLLSGQYARRHGIHDFATTFSDSALAATYPALLEDAGYFTGFIGKYGVGNEMPVDLFDVWHGFPGQGSYFAQEADGTPIHLTRLMGHQAEAFITEAATREEPFALSISFKAPHVEGLNRFTPDPAFDALYADATIPYPPDTTYASLIATGFGDIPNEEGRARWRVRFSTDSLYQANVKAYYRLINGVDAAVGMILDVLEAQGMAENTVILFTSDNGFYLGEYGLAGKWYGHDASIRIPLLIHDPRQPAAARGQVREEMVLNLDIAPTVLDLAGLPIPAGMQGESLRPMVESASGMQPLRQEFFYEHLFGYDGRIPRTEGVVGPRFKYLRYLDPEPDVEVLYDRQSDPNESINHAADPALQDTLAAMRARWEAYREALR